MSDPVTLSRLLPPLEAAHYLGITPELLFQYTRSSFKKNTNETRRLLSVECEGLTRFAIEELDSFDLYLKEPWSECGSFRTDPPKCVIDHIRAESSNQCARCGSGGGVQTAHIDLWAMTRSHHHHNLIRLCSRCHLEHDLHGTLSTSELVAIKQRLIERTRMLLNRRLEPISSRFRSPKPATAFFGQTNALSALRRGLQAGRSILVAGVAGIGKTQLVLQALQNIETGRAIIWIDVESYRSVDGILSALKIALRDDFGGSGRDRDHIASRLDAMQACVVFDGIENGNEPSLDELEDMLAKLLAETINTQFVFTSQVVLQRIPTDGMLRLRRLDPSASRLLLASARVEVRELDRESEEELLHFCEGHPLAIRLTAALVDFFGSGKTAISRIREHGAKAVQLQKRALHNKQTSLSVSLTLAYETLDSDEQRALWLVSNSPAGLLTSQLELKHYGISDAEAAVGGLRRWCLVQCFEAGKPAEQLHALSPIRSYVERRWREEHPDEAENLTKTLLQDFTVMAHVIDEHSLDSDKIPYMIGRYSQELPNLLRVIEAAQARPGDKELTVFAHVICSALMRYFFVLGLGSSKQGLEVMHSGVELALREGQTEQASDFILQLITLASRSGDYNARENVLKLLDQLSQLQGTDAHPVVQANVAAAKAIIALNDSDPVSAELWARSAISLYQLHQQNTGDDAVEEISNDLSAGFGLLGGALLAQHRFEDAKGAYLQSLEFQRGGYIAVNRGQILHQLGNCESHLANYAVAADCYADASTQFLSVGMQEYLGNSLGELGFTLIQYNGFDLTLKIPCEVMASGLIDVANHVRHCFDFSSPLDHQKCAGVLRKLFGVVALASFSSGAPDLNGLASSLKKEIITPFGETLIQGRQGTDGAFPLMMLDFILALAAHVASFERASEQDGLVIGDYVETLAQLCHHSGDWAQEHFRCFEWLAEYLKRRCKLGEMTAEKLQEACFLAENNGRFSLA